MNRRAFQNGTQPGLGDGMRVAERLLSMRAETVQKGAAVALDPNRTGREARHLEGELRRMIIGQTEAIEQIVNMYQMHFTGLCAPGRPVGNFLFLGPTGSGKTRCVEATAEALLGSARGVIKIDCAEFQHSHEIAKLIGSPPGYLGHRETHPLLSQEVLNQHHTDRVKLSFVLFDEIEKASDSLWNLLLGILDKATLTLGDNRKVDFSRAMIFMTSNLGANEMSSILSNKMGFGSVGKDSQNGTVDSKTTDRMARSGVEAARRKFTPEFMNRLDKVVVFKPLGEEELRKILDIELGMVQHRVLISNPERAFVFNASDTAKGHLLTSGTDTRYGARHLKRAIERLLVQPLSNLIATDQIRGGDLILVDYDSDGDRMTFLKEAEGLPVSTLCEMVDSSTMALIRAVGVAAPEPARAPAARRGNRG